MRATHPRPYGCASSACGARRSSGFSSTSAPRTGEPTATVRPERPCTVASVSPTSTRSTAQNSTSGVYQSTSPSGAVTPTVTMPSSICAHTCRPARYCLSDGSAKRADGAVAATEISATTRACRVPRTEPASGSRHDPPGCVRRAVESERPPLGEGACPVLRSADHGRRVAVLDVAAPPKLDLDDHRRGDALHLNALDPDPLDARAADHEPGLARGVAAVQQLAHGLGRGHRLARGRGGGPRLGGGVAAARALSPRGPRRGGGRL